MNYLENMIAEAILEKTVGIRVRNAGVFRFPPQYRFDTHNHSEIEINYVNHGSCIMETGGIFHPLKQGDCMIVYPGIPHQFLVDARENCRITQLEFTVQSPELLAEELIFLREDVPYRKLSACESISWMMENLCRICRGHRETQIKETLLDFGFFQLFIELSEQIRQQECTAQKTGKAGKITEIIAYINQNYEKEISIEELASKFAVSSRYIRKCFREETGVSCQKYICTLRISRAKELLWYTSKTATEIALETGFGSSQYFCRVFSQYTEMTPMEYRNLWKGKQAEELCSMDLINVNAAERQPVFTDKQGLADNGCPREGGMVQV
ncbi:MAG: AraC family transcriptional regulator [Candidatus Choladocola sp.]|nr:AraC family transcriptional regulator [Candidatus Choladocola sp.]